jgi:hypothetical protein
MQVRVIRLRQIGPNRQNENLMLFTSFEVFGSVVGLERSWAEPSLGYAFRNKHSIELLRTTAAWNLSGLLHVHNTKILTGVVME